MKQLFSLCLLGAGLCAGPALLGQTEAAKPAPFNAPPDKDGWIRLFDGKTLSGWEAMDRGRWHVNEEGAVVGEGPVGHIFSPNTYTNLEFKAQLKLNHSGNSGMYIRAARSKGFPPGYETQVENTSPDPQKTGSLYGLSKVTEQLVQDDTWWTQHVVAVGNRIIVKVNDKVVVDYVDQRNRFKSGYLAFQQHNDGSIVMIKNVMVKPLPDDEKAALEIVKKDLPELVKKEPAK